jgi:hypothetical protein
MRNVRYLDGQSPYRLRVRSTQAILEGHFSGNTGKNAVSMGRAIL